MMYHFFCRKTGTCKEHQAIEFEFKDQWPLTEFFQSELEKMLRVLKRSYPHIKDKALQAELKRIIDDFDHKIKLHIEWGQWK